MSTIRVQFLICIYVMNALRDDDSKKVSTDQTL